MRQHTGRRLHTTGNPQTSIATGAYLCHKSSCWTVYRAVHRASQGRETDPLISFLLTSRPLSRQKVIVYSGRYGLEYTTLRGGHVESRDTDDPTISIERIPIGQESNVWCRGWRRSATPYVIFTPMQKLCVAGLYICKTRGSLLVEPKITPEHSALR